VRRWARLPVAAVARRLGADDLDRTADAAFVIEIYRTLLQRDPEPEALEAQVSALRRHLSRAGLVRNLATSDEYVKRVLPGAGLGRLSDEAFVTEAYLALFGRVPEDAGLRGQCRALEEGLSRPDLILNLARSDEYIRQVLSEHSPMQDLTALRPERYRTGTEAGSGRSVPLFAVSGPEDVDWLEWAIHEFGYYEKPGVWSLDFDADKAVMAELLASFGPARALEVGCASGAVLLGLARQGVTCDGVDISKLAAEQADPAIRERIVISDVLDAELPGGYDLVFGLDIFEHFNPNRLDAYLSRVAAQLGPSGYLYANVPAFGDDPVFGPVFPFYLAEWQDDAAAGHTFSSLEVDSKGYPVHGHLVWADWSWWVARFEAAGLHRQPAVERALHAKYDRYFEQHSRARKAFFVFAGPACATQASVVERIRATPSVLAVVDPHPGAVPGKGT